MTWLPDLARVVLDVHRVSPRAKVREADAADLAGDVVVLCRNCHAILQHELREHYALERAASTATVADRPARRRGAPPPDERLVHEVLSRSRQGASTRQIAVELSLPHTTVARWIRIHRERDGE